MSPDRILGVLLIALQLFVLAHLSGARAFALVMVCATLGGLLTHRRLRLEPLAQNLTYAILSIGFLLHYIANPYPVPLDSQFIRSSLAHSIARLLITVQVLQLYLRHPGRPTSPGRHQNIGGQLTTADAVASSSGLTREGRLPIWIAGCGAVALSFAADVRVPDVVHQQLLWWIAAFMALFALYSSRSRDPVEDSSGSSSARLGLIFVALVAVVCLGTGAAWTMHRHERDIESFLAEYLGVAGGITQAGFAPSGKLQSVTQWKTDRGDRVMLRILADATPGYLRGKAFDTYLGSSRATSYTAWHTTAVTQLLSEVQTGRNRSRLRSGDRLYQVSSPPRSGESRVLDVWPEERTAAHLFTPLEVTEIGINAIDVRQGLHGIVTVNDRSDAVPYTVFAAANADAEPDGSRKLLSADLHHRLTSLDVDVDPKVRILATQLFADCHTTRHKLDAVERYFHENYTYKLGISVPRPMDPITYFLIQQPAAHCEYFATGTAVLLRLAGVPCRYVVGYVSQEWNPIGRFWVARNRDAHAWVEAYDEQEGRWVIVESTPAEGVPQPRAQGFASQITDSIRHRLSLLRIRLREYGLNGVLLSLVQILWSIPGLIVLLGILAVTLVRYLPIAPFLRFRHRPPARLKGMHSALALLDRRSREHGYQRHPAETLSQFADRLRDCDSASDAAWRSATADCYTLYVELRYQGQTGPDATQRFRQALAAIPPAPTRTARNQRSHKEQRSENVSLLDWPRGGAE